MVRLFSRCDWLAVWVLWSAWCGITGWLLSAVGQLDRAGFAVTTLLFIAGIVAAHRHRPAETTRPAWIFRRSTYARPLPKLWLALALLAFIGGLLYHPDNYDYLSYRFPRLLHWWWNCRWYWIERANERQNISAVGMEWLMAPLFVLFRTDRLFFLINLVSFLFLPGLIFSVFRRLGISGRVAWSWMWILPAGFCFILQAASMGNDAFAAVYFLAAIHYAFAARNGSPLALVLSLLSIALLTGAKASNIPLVLPWLVVLWLNRHPLRAAVRPVLLIGAGAVAAAISFLPIGLANILFTGEYTGDPGNVHQLQVGNPLAGVAGNTLEIAAGNLSPPLWPHALHWPFQGGITRLLHAGFPRFDLNTVPFQIEEIAGVGLGVVALAALGVVYGLRTLFGSRRGPTGTAGLIAGSIAVAWLAYMMKMGSEAAPRLVAVYYVAGIAALLLLFPVAGPLTRRLAWRGIGYAAMAMAFVLVVLNPPRPLLPVSWITGTLRLVHAPARAIAQLESNNQMRADRRDGLRPLCVPIPPAETTIGFVGGGDDPEVSLWLPFGSRQVVPIYPTDPDPGARHIRYVVVSGAALRYPYHMTLDTLLKKWSMIVLAQEEIGFKTVHKGDKWYLLAPVPRGS